MYGVLVKTISIEKKKVQDMCTLSQCVKPQTKICLNLGTRKDDFNYLPEIPTCTEYQQEIRGKAY